MVVRRPTLWQLFKSLFRSTPKAEEFHLQHAVAEPVTYDFVAINGAG